MGACPCRKARGDAASPVKKVAAYERKGLKVEPEIDEGIFQAYEACIEKIREHVKGEDAEEGILRISGRNVEWRSIVKDVLMHPGSARRRIKDSGIHDVASTLKELLRDTQTQCGSLLTQDAYEAFTNARDAAAAKKAVAMLPPRNKKILEDLVRMLIEICRNERTRMTIETCSTVLTPNLALHVGTQEQILHRLLSGELKLLLPTLASNVDTVFA